MFLGQRRLLELGLFAVSWCRSDWVEMGITQYNKAFPVLLAASYEYWGMVYYGLEVWIICRRMCISPLAER